MGLFPKTQPNVQILKTDAGFTKNITLIDKVNIHNNKLQVINQYEASGNHDNRYDVTILVNGFPLVHVELKRRGVAIREAFNQINRYQRDSFWSSCGLYEYVQIFVISNGTNTKYYSNSTRFNHIKDSTGGQAKKKEKTSNSFEFTSFWADGNNRIICDLVDFTKTFFAKHTILAILTKYCVFTSENMLLVMRPYQIVATERILNRIEIANNYKKYGSVAGGSYIWHTTLSLLEDNFLDNCYGPSTTTVAQQFGMSRSGAFNYLNALHKDGQIALGERGYESISLNENKATQNVPILGAVPCGPLTEAEEYIEGYVRLPESFIGRGKFYLLKASGNSMIGASINDGDLVLIKQQNTANVGDVIVALVENEVTLKRLFISKLFTDLFIILK